jgi:predicted RecB family nuclease
MPTSVTRDVLESYLNCKYKGYLKLAGEHGTPPEFELLRRERAGRLRAAAVAWLLARNSGGEVLRSLAVTPSSLKRGAALFLDATVESEGVAVRFDGLQKRTGPSRLGDFHYVPVLFSEAEKVGREQRALLEVLGLVLGAAQGKEPAWGVAIHGQNCEAHRVRLGAGVRQARRSLQEMRDMQKTGTPPRLVLNAHCQVCEFRQRCHAEAVAKDDLSLLRRLGEKEIHKLGKRGIFSVTQLSYTFRPPRRMKKPADRKAGHSFALQALAIREKKVHVLGTPTLPVSPARMYLDVEGDLERGFVYLLGLVVEANGAEERFSFWADAPDEEPRLFRQFLDVAGRHEDARIYCYGSYEAAFLRRMLQASGRPELGEKLLGRLVNVLSAFYAHVYFPTYSNGLKDVAGYLGFRWADADASGVQSVVWRRRWEETGSAALKDRLTAYNLDDCVALKRVTEFLAEIGSAEPRSAGEQPARHGDVPVARVEEDGPRFRRPDWCAANFVNPDFAFVNRRAYFDYQRDRVFIRTNRALRKSRARRLRARRRRTLRADRLVEIVAAACPACGGAELTRKEDRRLVRLAYDLRFTRGGIRRQVKGFATARYMCAGCGHRFVPREYLRLEEYFHSLKSWAVYKHVAHRMSFTGIAEEVRDCFGLPVSDVAVYSFKPLLARYYQGTYGQLLDRIVGGALLHADETEVHLKGVGKAYVWVFTNI